MTANNKDVAIRVRDLHKTFRIPLEGGNNLKQRIVNFARHKKGYREFSPLNGVDFEIKKGEFFGIVGRNGSGKSTLLKTIAGIYQADKGHIKVNGRLVPFIELGVGFNPELTGRENVYLNGALLGFSRDEMTAMYDDIVEFAELEEFMDERLKNYSSGMQVRLAFSIAIQADGDILLLDEVLAVGDESFQRKCYDYFAKLKENNKTVILVTHSMSAVNKFCTRALFLNDGKVEQIGLPEEIATKYSELNDRNYNKSKAKSAGKKSQTTANDSQNNQPQVDIEVSNLKDSDIIHQGDKVRIDLSWSVSGVKYAGVALMENDGKYLFGPNTFQDGCAEIDGNTVSLELKMDVAPGQYYIKAALFGRDDTESLANVRKGPAIVVTKAQDVPLFSGTAILDHKWSVDKRRR